MNNTPPPAEKKMGKSMMLIAWIIGLGLLTSIFGNWEKKQFNPNQSPQSRQSEGKNEVVLQRNRMGHYVSSGLVNSTPVVFLLDTGATNVAIPGDLEYKLGLERGPQHYTQTANGRGIGYQTRLNSLQIGNIVLYNIDASIVPGMGGEEILLGMSVLKKLEFSQKGDQLTLRQNH